MKINNILLVVFALVLLLCSGMLKVNTKDGQKELPEIVKVEKQKKNSKLNLLSVLDKR